MAFIKIKTEFSISKGSLINFIDSSIIRIELLCLMLSAPDFTIFISVATLVQIFYYGYIPIDMPSIEKLLRSIIIFINLSL